MVSICYVMLHFLNNFSLLYSFFKLNLDFVKKHGTNMAFIVLVDKILKAIDEGTIILGCF